MLIATAMSNGMYTGKVKWERLMPVRPEVIRQTPEQIARALSGTFDGLRKQAKKPKTTKKTKRHG